eukprot:6787794-Heterocapsa_arctica.AAC.1
MHMRCPGQGLHRPRSLLRHSSVNLPSFKPSSKMATMPEAQRAQSRELSRRLSHAESTHEPVDRPVGSPSCLQGELADEDE